MYSHKDEDLLLVIMNSSWLFFYLPLGFRVAFWLFLGFKKSQKEFKTKPTLNKLRMGKKLLWKRKNITKRLSDNQIYKYFLKISVLRKHIFNFFKEWFVTFLGIGLEVVVLGHSFEKITLFFIYGFWGPHIYMNQ